ncbi:MAG: hypothetical protein CL398_10490 [Acidiferrobacteraceae bacterium]|nr:hypothetical protein [Acidiferrobacteraceae bacterium]
MAPRTHILSYGMFDSLTGYSYNAEDTAVADAHARGARVVNMSYGPIAPSYLFNHYYFERMYTVMPQYKEMVFVKAAGNAGYYLTSDTYVSYSVAATQDPSVDLSNLIIVGAVDSNRVTTPWSNAPGESCFLLPGETVCQEKNKFKYFFMVAPGLNIHGAVSDSDGWNCWFTDPPTPKRPCTHSFANKSGTSMAAPHVSGAVAMLHGRWPVLKNNATATANILFTTADDLGEPGVDGIYGWGFLRVDKAFSPLGTQYMADASKRYPWGLNVVSSLSGQDIPRSNIHLSNALREVARQAAYVSVFDSYDRDFQLPLMTRQRDMSSLLRSEMGFSGLQKSETELVRSVGDTWSFMGIAKTTGEPNFIDTSWTLSLENIFGTAKIGYSSPDSWLHQPGGLALLRAESDVTTTGLNPSLQLVKDGAHISNQMDLSSNIVLATTYATNNLGIDTGRVLAPAEAFVLSVTGTNQTEKWIGNVTVGQINEEDGLLGSHLAGAFGQGGGFKTTSLTLSSDFNLASDVVLSTSYTMAQSDVRASNLDSGLLRMSERLTSDAFVVGLKKNDFLRESDQIYAAVSQPLRIANGIARLSHVDYYQASGEPVYRTVDIDLAPGGREFSLQLGYSSNLNNDSTVKVLLYHARDHNHVVGSQSSGGLVRFGWSF